MVPAKLVLSSHPSSSPILGPPNSTNAPLSPLSLPFILPIQQNFSYLLPFLSIAPSDKSFPPLSRADLVHIPVPDASFLRCSKPLVQCAGNLSQLKACSPASSAKCKSKHMTHVNSLLAKDEKCQVGQEGLHFSSSQEDGPTRRSNVGSTVNSVLDIDAEEPCQLVGSDIRVEQLIVRERMQQHSEAVPSEGHLRIAISYEDTHSIQGDASSHDEAPHNDSQDAHSDQEDLQDPTLEALEMLLEANATQSHLAALTPEGRQAVSDLLEHCLLAENATEPISSSASQAERAELNSSSHQVVANQDSLQVSILGAPEFSYSPLEAFDKKEGGAHSSPTQEEIVETPLPHSEELANLFFAGVMLAFKSHSGKNAFFLSGMLVSVSCSASVFAGVGKLYFAWYSVLPVWCPADERKLLARYAVNWLAGMEYWPD
ncbi:hypothetical protein Nepgr_029350 [Nepenthes gracilis]|uniref:Uncharacterized protein n=1 Tax=Nepenthes gracilis TaxID=150966 RepID=A0AAD3Y2X7_NEPGR|nr:hypothetical protein Nepgr_029350 [Nepenthes gracilis]